MMKPCMYFLQGRCKFGSSCRYSHDILSQDKIQALMIRHSISAFNAVAQKYQGSSFLQQSAQKQFQFNLQYIDCPLTQQGKQLALKTYIPKYYLFAKAQLDVIFVSPLNRALQTASLIISANKLKIKKILVLPQITQVLSKICDFSDSLDSKIKKYTNFDFTQIKRFISQNQNINQNNWQDVLVDINYKADIKVSEQNGKRYMKILKNIFPQPLESSQRCFQRSSKALERMRLICQKEKYRKVVIVAHNRILKYFDGRYNKGRARSFQNCQIRSLTF